MIKYPCKDCSDRHADCHQSCLLYLAEVRKAKKIREEKLKATRNNDYLFDSMTRMEKRRKTGKWLRG